MVTVNEQAIVSAFLLFQNQGHSFFARIASITFLDSFIPLHPLDIK